MDSLDPAEEAPKELKLSHSRIMYVENKSSGTGLEGPARVGRVYFSKSGKTLYYHDMKFQSLKGSGYKANYFDVDTGEQYWISGPRKDRNDGLYGGDNGAVIDDDVAEEYWELISKPSAKKTKNIKAIINNLVIKAQVGVGDIPLNSSKQAIEEILGKPEAVSEHQNNGQRTVDWEYPSAGIGISFEPSEGYKATSIDISSPKAIFMGLRPIGMKIEELVTLIPEITFDVRDDDIDWYEIEQQCLLFQIKHGVVCEVSVLIPDSDAIEKHAH